jgi:superfamily II DNA or RNA helicase
MIPRFNDILSKLTWSTIVCDEAHRIKTRTTQKRLIETKKQGKRIHITKAIKNLKSFRKIALTGTPFDKNPGEIWSILNWLDPIEFSSYWKFMEQHVSFDTDYWGSRKNFHLKDPQAFTKMLKPFMLRRTKKMVMPELPPLQITHVPIELNPKQRAAYDAIKNVKDMEVDFAELPEPMWIEFALTKLVRLLQCASDPSGLGLLAPSAKLEWLQEWISDHPNEPILVFSRYRRTAERVAAVIGADALVMGGSELKQPLTASRRIVATIAAMAEGYDLGHIGTAIYIDCEWSSILMQQSMERIDRGGNTELKNLIFLEAQNTVDQLVRAALDQKWNTKQLIDQFMTMEQPHEISSAIR